MIAVAASRWRYRRAALYGALFALALYIVHGEWREWPHHYAVADAANVIAYCVPAVLLFLAIAWVRNAIVASRRPSA